jgi:DNA primase
MVEDVLNRLGIKYRGKFNRKGWLPILCPFHDDTHFGSASIRENGVISCFVCGSKNLFQAVKLRHPDYTNKQIFEFLGTETQTKTLESVLRDRYENRVREQTARQIYRIDYSSLDLIEVDLNLYYCKSRKFTREYVDKFNIKFVRSGFYEGYFCTPLISEGKVLSYEFRKALEYERLKEVLGIRGDLEHLRSRFKELELLNTTPYNQYLSRPKTLYPLGNLDYKDYLFNYDNCDQNSDLYICEGIAGVAELMATGITNIVATYGSKLKPNQIKLLRSFKAKKFIVNDNDDGAQSFIWALNSEVENCYIYPELGSAGLYLVQKSGILDVNFF